MQRVLLGIFQDRDKAEEALLDLEESGFNPKEISVIAKDTVVGQTVAQSTGASVTTGAVSGATAGAALGGITGLLVGIGAITIPGIGALFIAGPVAAALGLTGAAATTVSGAATGALAGGLVGGLVGLGVPENEARIYEDRVKSGAILLAVPTSDHSEEARKILEGNGADQVRIIG